MTANQNPLKEKSFTFSLRLITYVNQLQHLQKHIIANQLLKSGTSIGANVWEAQHAESRADFIHKLKLAAKEAEETHYWLLLCQQGPGFPDPDKLFDLLLEIKKLLSSIIAKAKAGVKP